MNINHTDLYELFQRGLRFAQSSPPAIFFSAQTMSSGHVFQRRIIMADAFFPVCFDLGPISTELIEN